MYQFFDKLSNDKPNFESFDFSFKIKYAELPMNKAISINDYFPKVCNIFKKLQKPKIE